jgi:xanthine dehydrogenase accessory factor
MVLKAAADLLGSSQPTLLEIDMQGMEVEGPDMVCGGNSQILVEPLSQRAPYQRALALLHLGQPALLVKHLASGETALMDGQARWLVGSHTGTATAEAHQALATGRPVLAATGELLYDPLLPKEHLLILGAGHVGTALANLAPGLGFQVSVGDDRPAFLAPLRFPAGVALLGGTYPDIVAQFPFDAATYVVIVTRSHLSDLACVRAVLPQPWRYAGFMGSQRKTRLVLEQVAREGFDPAKVEALRAPIGLELGAETPEELAVAISAELIAARRQSPCLESTHSARKTRRQAL